MEAKVPARPRARFQRVPRATDGDSAARPDLDAPIVTARSLFSGAIRRALGAICLTSECDRSGAIDHRSDGFALAVTSVWDTGMAARRAGRARGQCNEPNPRRCGHVGAGTCCRAGVRPTWWRLRCLRHTARERIIIMSRRPRLERPGGRD
jgi:hypothetical protein